MNRTALLLYPFFKPQQNAAKNVCFFSKIKYPLLLIKNALLKLLVLVALLMINTAVEAQKTDKVFLKNGDVITGEIKNLKFAKLTVDMTGPGIIQIKWEEILRLKSTKLFQVTMRRGEVLVEYLDSVFYEKYHASLNDIVEIIQMKDQFLQRLDGNVNLGFNYANSSDIFQLNFGSSITYRKPKVETSLTINSVISSKSTDSLISKKQDISIGHLQSIKNNFYVQSNLGWQQNTQLGLQNRFSLNGVGGKIIFNDNQHRLLTGAGLSFNLEESNQSVVYKKTVEALATIQFKKFHYTTPKISLDALYTIYPNITEWGRIRMDFQLNTRYEIFKDFNMGLSFYDLYDNRPPTTTASKNDFGINFTLGYEFGK